MMADAESLRALSAAILRQAHADTLDPPRLRSGAVDEAVRDDARSFLTDARDRRLERWTALLDVNEDALRAHVRRRLKGK
jgi:hypothetical protein